MNQLAFNFGLLDQLRDVLSSNRDPTVDMKKLGPTMLKTHAEMVGQPGPGPAWEYITFMLWSATFDRGGNATERAKIATTSMDSAWNFMKEKSNEVCH